MDEGEKADAIVQIQEAAQALMEDGGYSVHDVYDIIDSI